MTDIRDALKECAMRCRYDGDLFHDQGNEMRRDASWKASDMAYAALAENNQEAWVSALLNAPNPDATPAVGGEQLDRETIQTLLNLLNPLHGSLDRQTYDEKLAEGFDAPRDYAYTVVVTAQQERDLTQAVLILENRRAQPASPLRGREPDAWRVDGKRNGQPQVWFYYKPEWPAMHEEHGDIVTPLYAASPEQPAAGDGETKA